MRALTASGAAVWVGPGPVCLAATAVAGPASGGRGLSGRLDNVLLRRTRLRLGEEIGYVERWSDCSSAALFSTAATLREGALWTLELHHPGPGPSSLQRAASRARACAVVVPTARGRAKLRTRKNYYTAGENKNDIYYTPESDTDSMNEDYYIYIPTSRLR